MTYQYKADELACTPINSLIFGLSLGIPPSYIT